MTKCKPRNLADVAKLAGVTRSAVSLALHDSPQVSEALKVKIKGIVEETGFTLRKYSRKKTRPEECLGKVLLIQYSSEKEDNVNAELENAVIARLNHHNILFGIHSADEIIEKPKLLDDYAGVLYYFDPPQLEIPVGKKCVQIFGFHPLPQGRDRVTANDEQIATLAVDYLSAANVKTMALVYRNDMIIKDWHPRIEYFKHLVKRKGLGYADFMYQRDEDDFDVRLSRLINEHGADLGFFAFSGTCAFDLYVKLNHQGAWDQFRQDKVVCGDTTQFLKRFWPETFLIGAPLEELAILAVDRLLERLRSKRALVGVTIMPETRIYSTANTSIAPQSNLQSMPNESDSVMAASTE